MPSSSPRLRRTGLDLAVLVAARRFIPAPAGNSIDDDQFAVVVPVHPRACGEQSSHVQEGKTMGGSSPRLRGTGGVGAAHQFGSRFIPAPAGNSVKSVNRYLLV